MILTDDSYPAIQGEGSLSLRIKSLLNRHSNSDIEGTGDNDTADALVLFTSGTTGKPKGVVHSFKTLSHQISDLHTAWEIEDKDEFFLCLPLNHIHGLVTGLLNGLAAGASLTIHSQFDANMAWRRLNDSRTTFFTAVPTIYSRLLNHARTTNKMKLDHLRLMISGSSPLSEPLLDAWTAEIRGSGIVERYGMTETGMIASNGLATPKPGFVGKAFPSVEIQVEAMEGQEFGQVKVRGPGLFKGYLNHQGQFIPRNPHEFFPTGDQGYFRTGDLKLVGRDRDILKVSGYKVGCGEIESAIQNHPAVRECAVIGLKDPKDTTNQIVAALIVSDSTNILTELRTFLSTRLAHYKIPRKWVETRADLPRNLIGKPDHESISALFQ